MAVPDTTRRAIDTISLCVSLRCSAGRLTEFSQLVSSLCLLLEGFTASAFSDVCEGQ